MQTAAVALVPLDTILTSSRQVTQHHECNNSTTLGRSIAVRSTAWCVLQARIVVSCSTTHQLLAVVVTYLAHTFQHLSILAEVLADHVQLPCLLQGPDFVSSMLNSCLNATAHVADTAVGRLADALQSVAPAAAPRHKVCHFASSQSCWV